MLAVVAVAACSGGSGPTAPTPLPAVTDTRRVELTFDQIIVSQVAASGYKPAYYSYAACGSFENVSRQNMIYWVELHVVGADGVRYDAEQAYNNLVPRKWGPVGARFGCGIASASDYNLSRSIAAGGVLAVHYTLEDGQTGVVEASAAVRQ